MKLERPTLPELGFIVSLIGVFLGAATLVPDYYRLEAVVAALVASVLTIYLYFRYLSPRPSIGPIDEGYEKRFLIKFPCSESEIVEANEIAKRCFGKRNVTPDEHFLGLYRHNRLVAVTLYDKQNKRTVGYIDLYPVTKDYLDGLRDGRYYEDELNNSNVLSESEMASVEFIYVAGIVVDDRLKSFDRSQASACLLLAYIKYFDMVLCSQPERKLRIGALAYTPDGARLLRKNGFVLTKAQGERGRKGDYFERTIHAKRGTFGAGHRRELRLPETICDLSIMEHFRLFSSG